MIFHGKAKDHVNRVCQNRIPKERVKGETNKNKKPQLFQTPRITLGSNVKAQLS